MAKILVVEDMDSVVDLLRSLLEREGFDVAVAQDGPEALEAMITMARCSLELNP